MMMFYICIAMICIITRNHDKCGLGFPGVSFGSIMNEQDFLIRQRHLNLGPVSYCFITEFKDLLGFQVVTPVDTKNTVFSDTTMCISLKVNQLFGGTNLLHFQGWRISRVSYQFKYRCKAKIYPKDGDDTFLQKSIDFRRPHGFIPKEISLFMNVTSKP
jgi:hypothetical protein